MRKLLLLFSVLIFSACTSYKMVDIDILSPSEYQILPSTQSITILNNATEQAPNVGHTTYKQNASYGASIRKTKVSNDNIKVDSTTTMALYNMYNHLEESQLFTSVEIGNKTPTTSTSESLDQLLQQHSSDAILLLESLSYIDNKNDIYYEYFDLEETEISVFTQSQWLLYYANNSLKPYRFTVNDSLYWNQADADRADYVVEAVWNNAKRSAEKIVPHWKSVNRLYYTNTNLVYREIDEAITHQNWEQAAQLWIMLYKGERRNTVKKGRLAFNMALFFELKNDLETAMVWLGTAIDIFTAKEAKSELEICSLYVKVLDNRLLNQEKLDQQFTE